MNQRDILDLLESVRFLHDIPETYLEPIAAISQVREFPAGAVLFREGQDHSSIYLIVEGAVALEVRVVGQSTRRLQTVGEGELLGWSPLLSQAEMTATARALRDTRAVTIEAAQLIAQFEHNPRFGLEFIRRTAQALSQRLNATRLQLLDVYQNELPTVPAGEEA